MPHRLQGRPNHLQRLLHLLLHRQQPVNQRHNRKLLNPNPMPKKARVRLETKR